MSARRNRPAPDQLPANNNGRPKASARALAQVIERSARIQGPAAQAYVARVRRAHPGASPAEIAAKLEKRYLATLTASGAAVGTVATFPGIGYPDGAFSGRRGDRVLPGGHRLVRAGDGRGIRHPRRSPGAPPRSGAGRPGRGRQQACHRRIERPESHQRRLAGRGHGFVADVIAGAVEHPAAQVRRQAVRDKARRPPDGQDAAGRRRRRGGRCRQPHLRQEDRQQRAPGVRRSPARWPVTLHLLPPIQDAGYEAGE